MKIRKGRKIVLSCKKNSIEKGMKRRISKLYYVILCFVIGILLFGSITVSANVKGEDVLEIESVIVPESAKEYAENVAGYFLAGVITNPSSYNVSLDNYENWKLGTPYTIFSVEGDTLTENGIYYFPILDGQEIKFVLSTFKVNDEWNASLGVDVAEQLSKLKETKSKSKHYILYEENQKLYAENEEKLVRINDYNTIDKVISSFEKMSFKNKEELIQKKFKSENISINNIVEDNSENVAVGKNAIEVNNNSDSISILSYTPGFSVYTSTSVHLNMTNFLVNQQDQNGNERGMCWAAAVATIFRYRTGDTSLRAYNVCDIMGIPYDAGGTIPEACSALFIYGINYVPQYSQLSYYSLNNEILSAYPVYMNCNSGSSIHAVTLTGYNTYGSMNIISFWNSGNRTTQTATYNSSGTTFSYNNKTWTWTGSAYN